MSESEVVVPPADPDVDTEAAALSVDDGKGNRMVPLSALIAAKKEGKVHRDRVKELEPVADNVKRVQEQLDNAKPYIDALVMNPQLKAEAIRIANGGAQTRPSGFGTTQPTVDEDPDAAAIAELNGYYLGDGMTPDLARARRALEIMDRRSGRQTDDRLRPLAGSFLGSRAETNVKYAMSLTDTDGAPMATKESILETVKMLGGANSPMLADPAVVDLLINNAIGLDKRNGRTPKPVDEPLYLDRQGGGRRQNEPVIDTEQKRINERLGITDDEFLKASKALDTAVATRKGVTF